MRHLTECDNCGKEIYTYCFPPKPETYRRYFYGKPLQEYESRVTYALLAPSILLCIECIEQPGTRPQPTP